jgi:hypothetical protein
VKYWTIDASTGHHNALHNLLVDFRQGLISTNAINSALTAYKQFLCRGTILFACVLIELESGEENAIATHRWC